MSTLGISDPTILNEKNFAYVESRKISMLVDHGKNAYCDVYIVKLILDATVSYYEGGIYACRSCNNTKFLSMCLKFCSYTCFAFLC